MNEQWMLHQLRVIESQCDNIRAIRIHGSHNQTVLWLWEGIEQIAQDCELVDFALGAYRETT